jgi:hypothetical protein
MITVQKVKHKKKTSQSKISNHNFFQNKTNSDQNNKNQIW